jgi:hypothetical protein
LIHDAIKQKVTTQGIKMFRGVELVLVTRQENVILLKAKLVVAEEV